MKENMNHLSGNIIQTFNTLNIIAHVPAPVKSKQIPAWQGRKINEYRILEQFLVNQLLQN
jgi:hypothetical protein